MTRSILVMLAIVLLVSGVGCGVKAPLAGRGDPYASGQYSFADEDLERWTAVGTANVVRRPENNLLVVTVPIRSASNKRLFTEYRATFFDPGGRIVDRSAWLSKVLEPNANDEVVINATTAEAVDFRIDFRLARIDP
jgi:hypothetical protein